MCIAQDTLLSIDFLAEIRRIEAVLKMVTENADFRDNIQKNNLTIKVIFFLNLILIYLEGSLFRDKIY